MCKLIPFHWRVSITYYFVININIGCLLKWPCKYPTSTKAQSVFWCMRVPGLGPCGHTHPAGVISIQSLVRIISLIQADNSFKTKINFLHSYVPLKLPSSTLGIILLTLVLSVQPVVFGHSFNLLSIFYQPYCV